MVTQKNVSKIKFSENKKYLSSSSTIFGRNVFNLQQMSKFFSKPQMKKITYLFQMGGKIDEELANHIADAVKKWAIDRGVTHYCHWFHPQTGITAEKHDAFLWFDESGLPFEKFSFRDLLQSEPDASSFPSGGLRSTFEARGYTAWDPGSPMFIIEENASKTLCIPSVFLSYSSEVLDFKTPLLKSNDVLSREVCQTLKFLGEEAQYAHTYVGAEQEFFVVPMELAKQRTDLTYCGRTLLGSKSPKGQELEDHYLGSIPSRVQDFLNEFEYEMYQLGVPMKTRHNEVAPAQFEVAPIFEESNLACDHNQLIMAYLKKVGERHGFSVLLHEKPFAGVNGSGKHVNWSITDSNGRNLLDPGKKPRENLLFLTFLVATLVGVYDNSDLLRASIASSGNEHRLGANEAPPAIISVYLGSCLNETLNAIEQETNGEIASEKIMLDLGASHLQQIYKDNTDRNRTSPFAFTGNKFEFRAVGSSAPISFPVCILNASVADGLKKINSKFSQMRTNIISHSDVIKVLKEFITHSKNIRFEGNGYSEDWEKEAQRRGLSNFKTTPEALSVWENQEKIKSLIDLKLFTENDLKSRLIIQQERYIKEKLVEMNCVLDIVNSQIIPVCFQYQKNLLKNLKLCEKLHLKSCVKKEAESYVEKLNLVYFSAESLQVAMEKFCATSLENLRESCFKITEILIPKSNDLRTAVDCIEKVTPSHEWPFPRYKDFLHP